MSQIKNKVIFDLNSKNTFNQLKTLFDKEPYNVRDKQLYWVTKTFYSIGETNANYWHHVIEVYNHNILNTYLLKLNCGHVSTTSVRNVKMYSSKVRIQVNCMECGGTGEVKFNE